MDKEVLVPNSRHLKVPETSAKNHYRCQKPTRDATNQSHETYIFIKLALFVFLDPGSSKYFSLAFNPIPAGVLENQYTLGGGSI